MDDLLLNSGIIPPVLHRLLFMLDDNKKFSALSSKPHDPYEYDNKMNCYKCSRFACSSGICISCLQAKSLLFVVPS